MKILAASDIHADLDTVEKLAKKAKEKNVDLVVLAGDLTVLGKGLEGLLKPLTNSKKKIAIIPGNHESEADIFFLSKKYPDTLYNLHQYSFKVGDVGFFGCGLANIGPNEISEDEVRSRIERSFNYVKDAKRKVLVVHMPPYKTKLDTVGRNVNIGSKAVREMIEKLKPDKCICGHVHETFGLEDKIGETEVFNVGPKGKIIYL